MTFLQEFRLFDISHLQFLCSYPKYHIYTAFFFFGFITSKKSNRLLYAGLMRMINLGKE